MAAEREPSNLSGQIEVVVGRGGEKPPPTRLNQFDSPLSVVEQITETARYAQDPKGYLESVLGHETLEARKDKLSIPTKIEKDIYGAGEHMTQFQMHIAKLLGKEHGLFFVTGVQAQLSAVKIHCERAKNNRAAWHVSSHLESHEENSFEVLYSLRRTLLGSDLDELPTVEEIKKVLELPSEQRPAAILVEIPNRGLGCQTYSFSDLEAMSIASRNNGVKFHCDGARLWEIEPWYRKTAGKTFADICSLFDTVYVSFYKGLRGVAGAMLVSNDEELINEAKTWRRRAGGNPFTLMYETVDCERGYNENIGTFDRKWAKMTEVVDAINAATKRFKNKDGEQIVKFWPSEPTCCQIRTLFQGYLKEELEAARDRVVEKINVQVFKRMTPKLTQQQKEEAGKNSSDCEDARCYLIEWMITAALETVETRVFVNAYTCFCEEVLAGKN